MLRGRIKGTDSAIYSILHASGEIYAIVHCFRCNIYFFKFKVTIFSGLGIWRILILAIYNIVSRYNA